MILLRGEGIWVLHDQSSKIAKAFTVKGYDDLPIYWISGQRVYIYSVTKPFEHNSGD